MSFKISNILDYNSFIALDIWSFKIKVLICKIDNQELKILWYSTLKQTKKDVMNGEIADFYSVSQSISKAILKAWKNLDQIPEEIIVWFNSSELLYDLMWTNYTREKPNIPITMEEIDTIIKNIEYKSLEKIKSKVDTRINIVDSELKLIASSLVSIYLDWQRVSNPINLTWKNVKLNIINIFSPISRFNIINNIISNLNKKLISIIPISLSLPKLIEDAWYWFDFNLFIDFWHSKTTIVLENNWEILWFNIINFWFWLLEKEFKQNDQLNCFDIENIITQTDVFYLKYKNIFDNFFNILFDTITISIKDIEENVYIKNLFISWSWVWRILKEKIKNHLEQKNIWKNIIVYDKYAEIDDFKEYNTNINTTVLSIAKVWKEILTLKKDPITRILRYIIYKYE